MVENGALAHIAGPVVGVGRGRGMGLLSVLMGLCLILIAIFGYMYPRVRQIEEELPDALTQASSVNSHGT
jgi:hypothetical protein